MDWSVFLDYLLKGLGSAAVTLIMTLAGILFAKLKSKIKDSKISNYVKEVVRAAEQLYPNQGVKMGPEKYKYVVEQVIAKFPTLTDNAYLKSLIEGAVFALNNELLKIEEKKKDKNKIEVIEASVIEEKKEESKATTNKLSSF